MKKSDQTNRRHRISCKGLGVSRLVIKEHRLTAGEVTHRPPITDIWLCVTRVLDPTMSLPVPDSNAGRLRLHGGHLCHFRRL